MPAVAAVLQAVITAFSLMLRTSLPAAVESPRGPLPWEEAAIVLCAVETVPAPGSLHSTWRRQASGREKRLVRGRPAGSGRARGQSRSDTQQSLRSVPSFRARPGFSASLSCAAGALCCDAGA